MAPRTQLPTVVAVEELELQKGARVRCRESRFGTRKVRVDLPLTFTDDADLAHLFVWLATDRWNGYNRQGSLDLSLMILDHYSYTGDTRYLHIPVGVVEFYWNLWKNTSTAPGKPMVFFPTQAVETWQCPGWPVDPSNCPTNDMPTVAGLHAILERLLSPDGPPPGTSTGMVASWKDMQSRLPSLPTRPDVAREDEEGQLGGGATFIACADCSLSQKPTGGAVNCTPCVT